MSNQAVADMIAYLENAAATVRRIEAEAEAALEAEGQAAYKAKMVEKARFLRGLADRAKPLAEAVGGAGGEAVHARLRKFSAAAKAAMGFDSVFYMSALLYPEDYQSGEPNDLERYVESLRAEG